MLNEKRLIDANVVYEMGHRTPFHIGIADLCDLKELLEDVPTVDAVEVVHGRWVMKETMIRSPVAKNAYCSVCLEETANAHNYCPNCGAKMDGDRIDKG